MSRFKDKFAIISGGASGMGAATAKRFVEEGGSVITLDLNEELGMNVAEEIGDSCEFFKADVSKAEDWNKLEDHLGSRFKEITSVVKQQIQKVVGRGFQRLGHIFASLVY